MHARTTLPAMLVLLAGCAHARREPVQTKVPDGTPPAVAAGPASTESPTAIGGEMMDRSEAPDAAGVPTSPANAVRFQEQAFNDNPPATTNIRRVSFGEEGADFDPTISRDGQWLAFASTQHRKTSDIYIKKVDSRTVTQLTNDPADDAMPEISPDGTQIAFASNRGGNWDVYVMPITGGRPVQLTNDDTDEIHPSWSPDGTRVVFNRIGATSNRWEMWVADVTNSSSPNFIGYGLFPKWCPAAGAAADNADRVVYQLGRERGRRSFSIWTIDVKDGQAGNPTEIASSADSALINPSWSGDGQWIAYVQVPSEAWNGSGYTTGPLPPTASLWMTSIDGQSPVRLTSGMGVSLSPAWVSNKSVFFVGNRNGRENIWAMDVTGAVATAQAMLPKGAGGGGGAGASPTEHAMAPHQPEHAEHDAPKVTDAEPGRDH